MKYRVARRRRAAGRLGAALALTALGAAAPAQTQTQSPAPTGTPAAPAAPAVVTAQLRPIEVTGSAIRRNDAETALPILKLTREDIDKSGATTAAELLSRLPVQAKSLSDGHSISVGNLDQKGLNSVNLRGMGSSSTLVLLNGRRMTNFASPGDEAAVDLNAIPMAAIDRVEVLLDGASAIYGADAIAGVVNFITRRDYQGVEVNALAGATGEGGAGRRGLTFAAGSGSLDRDGYNVFFVADALQTDALRSSQRAFIGDLRIPERLPHLLSGYTSPANLRLTSTQLDYYRAQGLTINGQPVDNRIINFSAPGCAPPASLYLPNGVGGPQGCTYDYMRDTELYPASDKFSLFTRGEVALGGGHRLFGEVSAALARTKYVGSSARITGSVDASLIPQLAGISGGLTGEDREIELRSRLLDAGMRTSELSSYATRTIVGLAGDDLMGWEYEGWILHGVNNVRDRDMHGYLDYSRLYDAVAAGTVNVLGPNDATGRALIESAQIDDVVRRAHGVMDQIGARASRPVMALGGGDLAVAVGGEFRWERQGYQLSELLMSDNILGDDAPDGPNTGSYGRKVAAVYGELLAPITKTVEVDFALRHDRYQGVGGSTNPKVALRWTPSAEWLFRGSFATGFRAPSLNDLYRATQSGSTSTIPDPVCMRENDNDLAFCADNFATQRYSNPNLKPERSRQFTIGAAFEPDTHTHLGLDLWRIEKRDVITEIGDDLILAPDSPYQNLIHRYNDPNPSDAAREICGDPDPTDSDICYLELRKENRGRQVATGLDLNLEWRDLATAWGTFGVRLYGTWMLQSKKQTGPASPYVSNLGRYVTDGVVQRWRHQLSLDWERGPWSTTLSNTWSSGYEDQNTAIDTTSGTIVLNHHVRPYSIWRLSGAYEWSKALTLRAGIDNLFDTPPPFSNQAYDFISGYDPSYTDPRGRYFYVGARYVFR